MPKLLIVDDEQKTREVIREYAEFNGYEVAEAGDGMEALAMVKENDYDIIVMDIVMPKLDGFSTVKELRKTMEVPVIMLSARSEEYDKLFAFDVGADDYVVKPFSPRELIARIGVILKRVTPKSTTPSQFVCDDLVINLPAREVLVDSNAVSLTPKEYELLVYLIKNKNIALPREQILSDIWGYDFGDVRTIDTHIKNLRNALGKYRNCIVTLRGIGYKFEG